MVCFGRARLAAGTARALPPLSLTGFRAFDLAAVRGSDFFCAVMRSAARGLGFLLAIVVLPSRVRKRLAQFAGVGQVRRRKRLERRGRKSQCNRNTPSTVRNSAGLI